MGLTQKLGTIPLAILTDSSNNVGIGAAANASFKLQVTGATNLTGVLTLGSTISNGTFTYTLPSATGTLALTSALSGYLPLTGGTLTGALTINLSSSASAINLINTSTNNIFTTYSNASNNTYIGLVGNNGVVQTNNDFEVYTGASYTKRLTIANTGNATFSNLIRVEGQYVQIVNSTNPSLYINNNVVQWQTYVKSNNNIAISDAVRDVLTLGYNGSPSFFQGCNVGIGTSSTGFNAAGLPLVVGSGSGNTGLTIFSSATGAGSIHFADAETTGSGSFAGFINYNHDLNSMQFGTTGTTPTERMRITSGGDILIAGSFNPYTSAGRGNITLNGTSNNIIAFTNNTSARGYIYHDTTDMEMLNIVGGIKFATAATERARITSFGYSKFSNNGAYLYSGNSFFEVNQSIADWTQVNVNKITSGTPLGIFIGFTGVSPNSTTAPFIQAQDSTAERFTVRSNGGIANYQANDVNLSDERSKKDIIPLESYWDKFKAIEIVKFKYKDQTHDDFNIGVIAQQVEKVAPEFVDIDSWGKTKFAEDEDEIIIDEEPIKSIYTSDLHHATIKVLQECMIKIEELKAEIDELKNR
jgi:hypothetical protein